jgi:hypothetical protein
LNISPVVALNVIQSNEREHYRLRAGDHRILFELENGPSSFMMPVTGRTFVSNTIAATNKSRAVWIQLEKQLNSAKFLLRFTVEDVEDARTIERAKNAHGKKPRIPWLQVKKDAGLD